MIPFSVSPGRGAGSAGHVLYRLLPVCPWVGFWPGENFTTPRGSNFRAAGPSIEVLPGRGGGFLTRETHLLLLAGATSGSKNKD